MSLSLSAAQVAGFVLAALPHLGQHGLDAPSASEAIAAFGASRSAAYAARRTVEDGLPGLFRSPGRPTRDAPVSVDDSCSIATQVVPFLMDHPGCVTGTSLRRTYSASYRLFVLELRDAHAEVELVAFADAVQVPLRSCGRDPSRRRTRPTSKGPSACSLSRCPHWS